MEKVTRNKTASNNKFFSIGSLYQWAFLSFLIVAMPLLFVIIYTVIEVANYTQKSQETIFQVVSATENSRVILERLISMERSIRQYQVLNEPEFFESYREHRNTFWDVLKSLRAAESDTNLKKAMDTLYEKEKTLHQTILTKSKKIQPELEKEDLNGFDELTTRARFLLSASEKRVSLEATTLSTIAQRLQIRLIYSAFLSIPLALILGLIFVYLLTRPIKKIGQAIRNLGEIGLETPIAIKGPKDLTELGQHLEWLRKRLNYLEHEKQQFIRNVSHELKTPLATLKEGTDLLSENVVGELNTEQRDIINLMKMGNITIHDLVENLLEYQKTISTKIDLNFSIFEFEALIKRVINEYKLPIRSKNITLECDLAEVNIKADYEKMKIIVNNVFSNSLKFSPNDGTIGLKLYSDNDVICLEIDDQGPGVAEEIKPFIYENFYQGDSPQAWKIKGSGLGLALVKHYLDAHKGTITLLPANKEYSGARFFLQLPKNREITDANIH